ncbi:hypothetical protein BLA29_012959, partial [Euroglyphus maynei]
YFHSTILIQRRRIGFLIRRQYNTRSAFSGTFGTLRTILFGCCCFDDADATAMAAGAVAGVVPVAFVAVDCATFNGIVTVNDGRTLD